MGFLLRKKNYLENHSFSFSRPANIRPISGNLRFIFSLQGNEETYPTIHGKEREKPTTQKCRKNGKGYGN